MNYADYIDRELQLPRPRSAAPSVLDLFAGCGGLALGFEAAGFTTTGYEMDPDACATYRSNLHGSCYQTVLTPETDFGRSFDVVIGGPPCQPFSVGGLQAGQRDSRDGFPAFLAAVRQCSPKVVLFENVRGMLYQNRKYFETILRQLADSGFQISYRILGAVDFGVPQRRERLFVVGHRGSWRWPEPLALRHTAGDALGDMANSVPEGSKFLTPSMDKYVAKYEKASKCIRPRDLHLDAPSRTVTCRNLNGATGDMLRVRLPDGRRRRLVVREGARLQSFPDWFQFSGAEGSQFNQVGNAVPPLLAKAVAQAVRDYLSRMSRGEIVPNEREEGQLEFTYT